MGASGLRQLHDQMVLAGPLPAVPAADPVGLGGSDRLAARVGHDGDEAEFYTRAVQALTERGDRTVQQVEQVRTPLGRKLTGRSGSVRTPFRSGALGVTEW
jgi:hypothetical protein